MGASQTSSAAAASTRAAFLTAPIVVAGFRDAVLKLDPRVQLRNPVMFVVYVGSMLTTTIGAAALSAPTAATGHAGFVLSIAAWLWLTVLFANFAEAVAEGRGKAQAAALRSTRTTTTALRRTRDGHIEEVPAPELQKGDFVVVEAGMIIPADGEIVEGVGSVDES